MSSDLIWGLIALDSGDYPAPKAYQEALIDRLTEYQHEKTGGFFSVSYTHLDVYKRQK